MSQVFDPSAPMWNPYEKMGESNFKEHKILTTEELQNQRDELNKTKQWAQNIFWKFDPSNTSYLEKEKEEPVDESPDTRVDPEEMAHDELSETVCKYRMPVVVLLWGKRCNL